MTAKVYSAIPDGYSGQIVEIQGHTARSLPCFNIIGMADKTISEARDRIRAAIANSELIFPAKKVTINLAPATLNKSGSHLDLPIALAILLLSDQLLECDLDGRLFVGELSLSGDLRPVSGIINITEAAKAAGFKEVILPTANLPQANLVKGIHLVGADNLRQILLHLRGIIPIPAVKLPALSPSFAPPDSPSFSAIQGQTLAKRALVIALAGRHNLLLSGPPGAGKTLLAHAAAGLLPPPTPSEIISITKIHSLYNNPNRIITARPFRAPHHTASTAAIIGGGGRDHFSPGEISLAHHGILFLDEFPEFSRATIEALRQPLEDRIITITRVNRRTTFPANFMLIATMNPCPCGHYGDDSHPCTCLPHEIKRYRSRISGPIYDRIDLIVNLSRVKDQDLFHSLDRSSSQNVVKNTQTDDKIRQDIADCLTRQQNRYRTPNLYNNSLTATDIAKYLTLAPAAKKLLKSATRSLQLSARSYFKTIKVAATIADLDHSEIIRPEHISEALAFRGHDRTP